MRLHEYTTPAGERRDKRMWPIGTLVTAKLTGGSEVSSHTVSVPRQVGGATWCVRCHGVAYLLALERVSPRFQTGLWPVELDPSVGSEKDTSTPEDGNPRG